MIYNTEKKCVRHETEVAATCEYCHLGALRQQNEQWKQEREKAHAGYLGRLMKKAP